MNRPWQPAGMTRSQRNRLRGLGAAAVVGVLAVAGLVHSSATRSAEAFPVDPFGLGSNTHNAITKSAITTALPTLIGVRTPTPAISAAIGEIIAADVAVDGDQFSSAKHFDAENFSGAKTFIVENHAAAITQLILTNDVRGARISVGSALHTIQDFYAHTNWVELGNTVPNANLWNGRSIGTVAGATEATCDPIDSSILTTRKLTSGYFGGQDRVPAIFPGKCRHGGPTDLSLGFGGISKDFNNVFLSPHSQFHQAAANLANQSTQQFLKDILAVVGTAEMKTLLGAA
jgi:hypothetical protein